MSKYTNEELKQLNKIPQRIDVSVYQIAVSNTKCYMCKKRTDIGEPILNSKPGKFSSITPSGKFLFHLYEVHGQPVDWTLSIWAKKIFKNPDEAQAYLHIWGADSYIN